jgi:hypothetical protein
LSHGQFPCHIPSTMRRSLSTALIHHRKSVVSSLWLPWRERQCLRWFSASSNRSKHNHDSGGRNHQNDNRYQGRAYPHGTIRRENPFEILGIPKTATYQQVKRRFVELALQHHPDTKENDNRNEKSSEEFIRLRQAFEAVKEDQNGMASTRDELDEESLWSSDEEFHAWFYEETRHADLLFRMDLMTRKEVIEVGENLAQGGLDRGGMWEMARRMAEQEEMLKHQKGKFKKTSLGLEGSPSAPSSSVRRRRNRNG